MLEKQVAIVTGGGNGIGQACVEKFTSLGAEVVVADLDEQNGIEFVETLKKKGRKAYFIKTDVSIYENVQSMVMQVVEQLGKIDILVNNAGNTTPPCYCTDMENEVWSSVINVHLNGTFYCTKLVAPEMKRQNYGRIVNLSSLAALSGLGGQCNYATAKAGLVGFTYALAKELGPYGITVNAVQPGLIRSNITSPMLSAFESQLVAQTPVNRIGDPADVASTIAYLVSPEAGFVTGTCVKIDGGYLVNTGLDQLMNMILSGGPQGG